MDKNFNKEVGQRIRQQREFLNLTREELSEKSEISTRYISDIENGKKKFSSDIMRKLCEALHMSADKILFDRDNLTDVQQITKILETIDERHIPLIKENLLIFLKALSTK